MVTISLTKKYTLTLQRKAKKPLHLTTHPSSHFKSISIFLVNLRTSLSNLGIYILFQLKLIHLLSQNLYVSVMNSSTAATRHEKSSSKLSNLGRPVRDFEREDLIKIQECASSYHNLVFVHVDVTVIRRRVVDERVIFNRILQRSMEENCNMVPASDTSTAPRTFHES